MPAPIGNQNAAKGHRWRDAIERALQRRSKRGQIKAIDELADKFLDEVQAAGINGYKEFADRMDGKAAQPLEHSGDIHLSIAQADADL